VAAAGFLQLRRRSAAAQTVLARRSEIEDNTQTHLVDEEHARHQLRCALVDVPVHHLRSMQKEVILVVQPNQHMAPWLHSCA